MAHAQLCPAKYNKEDICPQGLCGGCNQHQCNSALSFSAFMGTFYQICELSLEHKQKSSFVGTVLVFIFIFQLSGRPRKSAGLLLEVSNFKENVLFSLRRWVKTWGTVMVSGLREVICSPLYSAEIRFYLKELCLVLDATV